MSGDRNSEQPQRYCGNCGAEIRPDNAFCVSCGAPATPRAEESGPTHVSSAGPPSPFDKLLTQLQQAVGRFREAFWGQGSRTYRGHGRWRAFLTGTARRFGATPLTLWVATGVVLVLLILLVPAARWAAVVVLLVSIVAVGVQAQQRKPIEGWGLVLIVSFTATVLGGLVSADPGDGGSRPTEQVAVDDVYTPILQDAVFTPGIAGEECAAVVDCDLIKRITVHGNHAEVILFDVKRPTMFEGAENDLICSGVADVAAQEGVPINRVVVKSQVVRRAAPDYGVKRKCGVG